VKEEVEREGEERREREGEEKEREGGREREKGREKEREKGRKERDEEREREKEGTCNSSKIPKAKQYKTKPPALFGGNEVGQSRQKYSVTERNSSHTVTDYSGGEYYGWCCLDFTLCSMAEIYRRFGRTQYCFLSEFSERVCVISE
jgi:hypothetical protein